MAASGISPFETFRRLRFFDLLPETRKEAFSIVRQVEVLGSDPLTVLNKRAESSTSKFFRDLLGGYVSTVKSGGSVVTFLRSKMRSIFELQSVLAKQAVEKISTLVEAYMVMLVVSLTIYVMSAAIATTSLGGNADAFGGVSTDFVYPVIFGLVPGVSIFFMWIVNRVMTASLLGLDQFFRKAMLPAIGAVMAVIVLIFIVPADFFSGPLKLPYLVGGILLGASLQPFLSYRKIAGLNFAAENVLPSFIRDVAEARKTGISPEKSIVHAAHRKGYGRFAPYLQKISDQLEWGVPLRKIFRTIQTEIRSWPVLVNFLILVETIEVGGGYADTLEILAEASEKTRNVESEKRSQLKPYVLLPFIVTILIVFTTILMIEILTKSSPLALQGDKQDFSEAGRLTQLFASGILIHTWLTGFFIGKVTEGSLAAGFKYSFLLMLTALLAVVVTFSLNIGSLL